MRRNAGETDDGQPVPPGGGSSGSTSRSPRPVGGGSPPRTKRTSNRDGLRVPLPGEMDSSQRVTHWSWGGGGRVKEMENEFGGAARSAQAQKKKHTISSAPPERHSVCRTEDRVMKTQSTFSLGHAKSTRKEGHNSECEDHKPKDAQGVWAEVFKKLRDDGDGEVHRDCLSRALELMGFVEPDQSWIDEVYDGVSTYSSLSLEDYMKFVQAYQVRQHQAYTEAFDKADADGSSQIDVTELAEVMRSFGIQPMQHVLDEVIYEVDDDGEGQLDLQEFERIMELLKSREGFTRREYEEFMVVYARFDRDFSGEIDTRELKGILCWLGYVIDPPMLQIIIDEVDVDLSRSINEREFLMCMRRVRELEVAKVMKVLATKAQDQEGSNSGNTMVPCSEVENLVRAMGYLPDPDAVSEALLDVGIAEKDLLDLGRFWQFLTVYRSREGLSARDAEELDAVFTRFDDQGEGEISTFEVGKLLRTIGYAVAVDVLQQFINRVDVDGSGNLDQAELRKLLRMLREEELTEVRDLFAEFASEQKEDTINQQQMYMALHKLGCMDGDEHLAQINPDMDFARLPAFVQLMDSLTRRTTIPTRIDRRGFIRIYNRMRVKQRAKFQDNCGFSFKEIKELKELFASYDLDNGGDIQAKEQIKLIEDYFPEMAHDKLMRPQLMNIIAEADPENTGSLVFSNFCRLMQQLRELKDQAKIAKESHTIKDTGLTVQEVQEFRDLFLSTVQSKKHELTFPEVETMIGGITPLGDKYLKELRELLMDIEGRQHGASQALDFPDFLRLMMKLLKTNFARINEKIAGRADP